MATTKQVNFYNELIAQGREGSVYARQVAGDPQGAEVSVMWKAIGELLSSEGNGSVRMDDDFNDTMVQEYNDNQNVNQTLNEIGASNMNELQDEFEKFHLEKGLSVEQATSAALLSKTSENITDAFLDSFEKSDIGQEIKDIWDKEFEKNPEFKEDMDKYDEMYEKVGQPIYKKLESEWTKYATIAYNDPSNTDAANKEKEYEKAMDDFFDKWDELENNIKQKHNFDDTKIKQAFKKNEFQTKQLQITYKG